MGQPLGWNTQSAHWSKAKFNKSWEEEMKTSIVPAWKHKGNLGAEWNQATWNFASVLGIKSLALEKRVFKWGSTSPCRCLQDNVCAAAPFPQGSHANSLEATESPLPALRGCCVADGAVEHGLTCLPAYASCLLWRAPGCHTPGNGTKKISPPVKVCSLQSALHESSTFCTSAPKQGAGSSSGWVLLLLVRYIQPF